MIFCIIYRNNLCVCFYFMKRPNEVHINILFVDKILFLFIDCLVITVAINYFQIHV